MGSDTAVGSGYLRGAHQRTKKKGQENLDIKDLLMEYLDRDLSVQCVKQYWLNG